MALAYGVLTAIGLVLAMFGLSGIASSVHRPTTNESIKNSMEKTIEYQQKTIDSLKRTLDIQERTIELLKQRSAQ